MPTPRDRVEVRIGSRVHSDWESYEVDSDLMTPADAWSVSLGVRDAALPDDVVPGVPVRIQIDGDDVMVGRVDEISHRVDRRAQAVSMSGRDGAGVLLDCSAPVVSVRSASLEEVVATIVRPLGITAVRIDAEATAVRERVTVEPGDTAWTVLANAAAAAGLWPWFTPDGTLVVGRPPDSTGAFPVARLELGPRRSNVLDLARRQSMHSRFSEVTVLGQGPGTHTDVARTALWDRAVDTGVQYHRPRIVVDHESESTAMCRARARKVIADARLSSYDLVARVARHRIHAPGTSSDGLLWTPGQRVHVVSAPHRIDGVFFVMARRFSGGREHGAVTTLTLKEDGVWQIDAHPHQRRYRRGRNAIAGNIEDAPA